MDRLLFDDHDHDVPSNVPMNWVLFVHPTTILLPVEFTSIPFQPQPEYPGGEKDAQVAPEVNEYQSDPPYSVANIRDPSLDIATRLKLRVPGAGALLQVVPPSFE